MRYSVKPQGICPTDIAFDLEGNVVKNIEFTKGCNGNLKAIARLVNGMTVEQLEDALKGNLCGNRGTSCVDQLCIAVRAKYNESLGNI